MAPRKSPKKAGKKTGKTVAAQDVVEGGGVDSSIILERTRAALAESEGRISRVEGGFDRLTKMVANVQDHLEKLADSRATEGSTESSSAGSRSRRRARQPSPTYARGRSSSEASSDDEQKPKRASSKHDSAFSQKNFVEKGTKVDSFETLMLVSVRTVLILLKQGEDVEGLLSHMEMLCEKAMTKVYRVGPLVTYDKSVRDRADLVGPEAFGTVLTSDVFRFFSYDSTVVSVSKLNKNKPVSGKSGEKRPCFAFNKGKCEISTCRYSHTCIFCRSASHGSMTCSNSKSDK